MMLVSFLKQGFTSFRRNGNRSRARNQCCGDIEGDRCSPEEQFACCVHELAQMPALYLHANHPVMWLYLFTQKRILCNMLMLLVPCRPIRCRLSTPQVESGVDYSAGFI